MNPANWGSAETEPVPGEDEDFPSLSSVPDKPDDLTSIEVIEQVQQSLLADSANAQHTAGATNRVGDETSIEPMPEVIVPVEVEEETVIEEDVESGDGSSEEVIIEEDVDSDGDTTTDEVIIEEDSGASLEVEDTEDVAVVEPAPAEPEAVQVVVAEETSMASVQPAAGVAVVEEEVAAPAPAVSAIVSDDDALPPQRVSRAVETEATVAEADVPEPGVMESAVVETAVVETAPDESEMVTQTVEVAAIEPAPAAPSQSSMDQTFDTLFNASGPEGDADASNPVPAFVAADNDVVVTQAPTITDSGYQALVAIIRFNTGSSALDDNDRQIIGQLADAWRQRGGGIRLAGYASRDQGSVADADVKLANFNISLDRAVAVADELVRVGVPSDDIEIDARGDSAAVALASAGLDEADQRRVEVYFTN